MSKYKRLNACGANISLPSSSNTFLSGFPSFLENLQEEDLMLDASEETLFKTFIKKIPAAVAILNKDLKYIITSDRWTAETKLQPQEIIGRSIYDVIPDLPQKWRKIHARALRGERLKSEEDLFKRKDGSLEWWKWEVLPWYDVDGVLGGIILFVELLAKHKRMEKRMVEIIKSLNRSNAELEKFAHICAHDLNEPLRTIANYIDIIEGELQEEINLKVKEYLEVISKSVRHMSSLVNGILTYSQFKASPLNKSFFSAQYVMNCVKMLLEKTINENEAFIYAQGLPEIYGDMSLIARVFQNLISNSLKFNENDLPIIYVTAKEQKRAWLFCIEDNGIGIDSTYHKKIFELFGRLHASSRHEGMGIGLSISKKIIEAHGGKMWVQSSPPDGSQFFFTLPKAKNVKIKNQNRKDEKINKDKV